MYAAKQVPKFKSLKCATEQINKHVSCERHARDKLDTGRYKHPPCELVAAAIEATGDLYRKSYYYNEVCTRDTGENMDADVRDESHNWTGGGCAAT